jgi:gliding motility-associated-like protein
VTALWRNTIILIGLLLQYCGKAQVCEDSVQSYALYSTYKIEHIGGSFLQLQNGYSINTARVNTPAGLKLSIILTDNNGQLLRAKYIELADPTYTLILANIIESPDNTLIAYGRLLTASGNEKAVVIMKFDINLTLQWSTLVRRSITEPETALYEIWGLCCDAQSNIYFSFHSEPGGPVIPPNVFFVSLDAGGALRWSKGIHSFGTLPSSMFAFNASTVIGNKAFFIGNYQSNNSPGIIGVSFDRNTGSFVKMSIASPNTIGTASLSYQDQNIHLWPRNSDFYYAFGELTNSPTQNNIVHVLVDTSFTITRARRIKGTIWAYSWRQINLGKNGSISFLGHDNPVATGISTDHFAVVDSAGNTLISKKVDNRFFVHPELYPAIISEDEQRVSISVGNRPAYDSMKRISLPLYGDTTLYSCLGKDTSFFSIENATLITTDINPGTVYSNIVQLSALNILTSDFTAQKQEFCKVKSICSSLHIKSDSLFCTEVPQVFVAEKNDACFKKIRWELDGIPATLTNTTDSSIALQFHTAWNGTITAGLQGCDLTAVFTIAVKEPLTGFSLGNEKIICPGDSVSLSAPAGYQHYQWSTGDTTAAIRAGVEGTYSVSVADYCGNIVSTSVSVKNPTHISPIVSNMEICKGDSVFIKLQASLSSIDWNPSVTAIDDSSFYTVPAVSTAYTIQAKDEYDCPYSNGFAITVNPCTEQLWLPNAFTPNGDNLNDSFGATVDGHLRSFHLSVYNRWGQLVFASTDPDIKWDGILKGSKVPSGVYVWTCRYQFLHGPVIAKKGTVALIY